MPPRWGRRPRGTRRSRRRRWTCSSPRRPRATSPWPCRWAGAPFTRLVHHGATIHQAGAPWWHHTPGSRNTLVCSRSSKTLLILCTISSRMLCTMRHAPYLPFSYAPYSLHAPNTIQYVPYCATIMVVTYSSSIDLLYEQEMLFWIRKLFG